MRRPDPDHPAGFGLSQFVDGELDPLRREEVARHIEACDGCRAEVRFFEELREATRGLEFERPSPPDVADAVIRRRRAGERGHPAGVVAPVIAASRRRYGEVAAAALVGVVALSAYLLLAPTAAATRGELSFGAVPSVPGPGAVPVDYQPAYYLADEDSLRLRARVYAASGAGRGSRDGTIREFTLRRQEDGRFAGWLSLRPEDVFAVAAVEDFEGIDLDTNSGRLWELYAAGEREPSFAALESHFRALEAYNPVLATEWAKRLTERYPENPLGWALSYRHHTTFGPEPVPDSLQSFYSEKFDELLQTVGSEADPAELAWLSLYARYLEEPVVQDSLLTELAARDPDHPAVIDRQVLDAARDAKFGSAELLERLEALWVAAGRASELLVHSGVQAAAAAGQPEAVLTWVDRGLGHDAVDVMELVADLTANPGVPDQRARLLRRRLAELDSRGMKDRPLRSSVPEQDAARRDEIPSVKVRLADVLLKAGDDSAAMALYRDAAGRAWRAEDLRPYVEFLLARGDTVGAMPVLGMLVADPIDGDQALADYAQVIRARTDDPTSFIERSQSELARRILRDLPPGSTLRDDTRLTVDLNEETTAAEYFSRRPSVLLFWDARLDDRSDRFTTFEDLAGRTWTDEIRSVVVLSRPPKTDSIGTRVGIPTVFDSRQELRRQVREFAVPLWVVLDPGLRIVATSSNATVAFRIAKALVWTGRTEGERAAPE